MQKHKPRVGIEMSDESGDLGEENGDGRLKRRGKTAEILLLGEVTDDVDHANLANAGTRRRFGIIEVRFVPR